MDANQITDRFCHAGRGIVWLAVVVGLSACATASRIGDLASAPLEYVGLMKSSADDAKDTAQQAKDAKEAAQRAAIRNVKLSLFAGQNLNTDASGQSLALVVRIYTLRDAVALQQAPYPTFTSPERETAALGSDIIKSREVVLIPGQRIDATQDIGPDVNAIAVVALFHDPAPSRWRLVFNLKEAAKEGIVIGANACALTVTSGLSGSDAEGRPLQLLPPQCPK